MKGKMTFILMNILMLIGTVGESAFINAKAPDFTLQNLTGETYSLSEAKGNVVFVNFWASWCPPCKKEFPELNELAREFKNEKFTMFAVNLDKNQTSVEKYLDKIGIKNPEMKIVLDPESKVVAAYVARSMPSSFIIDKRGVIRYVHFGFSKKDPEKWRDELKKLLKEE